MTDRFTDRDDVELALEAPAERVLDGIVDEPLPEVDAGVTDDDLAAEDLAFDATAIAEDSDETEPDPVITPELEAEVEAVDAQAIDEAFLDQGVLELLGISLHEV